MTHAENRVHSQGALHLERGAKMWNQAFAEFD